MSQSLAKIVVHLIFSTKNRQPLLKDEIRGELHAYLATVFDAMHSPALLIGSVEDHAHTLFALARIHALAEVVEEVKKSSSKWLKTKGVAFADFHWQGGYGAFSVSESNVEQVRAYIASQREHHKTTTFQDEFRAFLHKYNVPFDERYVWD